MALRIAILTFIANMQMTLTAAAPFPVVEGKWRGKLQNGEACSLEVKNLGGVAGWPNNGERTQKILVKVDFDGKVYRQRLSRQGYGIGGFAPQDVDPSERVLASPLSEGGDFFSHLWHSLAPILPWGKFLRVNFSVDGIPEEVYFSHASPRRKWFYLKCRFLPLG